MNANERLIEARNDRRDLLRLIELYCSLTKWQKLRLWPRLYWIVFCGWLGRLRK
jgi:hypothetical protein